MQTASDADCAQGMGIGEYKLSSATRKRKKQTTITSSITTEAKSHV